MTINLEGGTFHLAKWVSTSGGGWGIFFHWDIFFRILFGGFKSSQVKGYFIWPSGWLGHLFSSSFIFGDRQFKLKGFRRGVAGSIFNKNISVFFWAKHVELLSEPHPSLAKV